jgi:hypothetical protein
LREEIKLASKFYIQSEKGAVYELTVTSEVEVFETTSITRYRTESKEVISDNAVVNNRTVRYNGFVSSIRRLDQLDTHTNPFQDPVAALQKAAQGDFESLYGQKEQSPNKNNFKEPSEFIKGISTLRNDKETVTFFVSELEAIPNCMITSFSYIKDKSMGLTSWKITLEGEEIRISDSAIAGVVEVPKPSVADITGKENDSGNGSTTDSGELTTTIIVSGVSLTGVNTGVAGANN